MVAHTTDFLIVLSALLLYRRPLLYVPLQDLTPSHCSQTTIDTQVETEKIIMFPGDRKLALFLDNWLPISLGSNLPAVIFTTYKARDLYSTQTY